MLTFGTGVGSALFTGGLLVRNTEFGHLEIRGKDAEKRASEHGKIEHGWGWKEWTERVSEYLQHVEALRQPRADHRRRRDQQGVGEVGAAADRRQRPHRARRPAQRRRHRRRRHGGGRHRRRRRVTRLTRPAARRVAAGASRVLRSPARLRVHRPRWIDRQVRQPLTISALMPELQLQTCSPYSVIRCAEAADRYIRRTLY